MNWFTKLFEVWPDFRSSIEHVFGEVFEHHGIKHAQSIPARGYPMKEEIFANLHAELLFVKEGHGLDLTVRACVQAGIPADIAVYGKQIALPFAGSDVSSDSEILHGILSPLSGPKELLPRLEKWKDLLEKYGANALDGDFSGWEESVRRMKGYIIRTTRQQEEKWRAEQRHDTTDR